MNNDQKREVVRDFLRSAVMPLIEEVLVKKFCQTMDVVMETQSNGWQPIDTAPRDGAWVLLATPSGKIASGCFHPRYKVWSWPYVMVEPTHWMPMPDRPKALQQGGGG